MDTSPTLADRLFDAVANTVDGIGEILADVESVVVAALRALLRRN